MSFNSSANMGNILGSRIKKGLRDATTDAQTSDDFSIANVRAGWQQRYGALQMEDVVPHPYALFGGWSGSSTTVAP